MIILCTHNDGGVGKTTLAIHATGALASEPSRILLIDCDDQADSWQFYAGRVPKKQLELVTKDNISVIWNKKRESLKRLAKPEQYDHVVLDIDSPLQNTVQIIVDTQPKLILVPINKSQEKKALRNLHRTLAVVFQLESKAGSYPEVIIVPMGVKEERISQVFQKIENKPTQCRIAAEMPDLQEQMQLAIYEDRKYIWDYEGHEHLREYFYSLIEN